MHVKALNANADQVLDDQVIEANVKVSKITHSVEIIEFFRHSYFLREIKTSQSRGSKCTFDFCNTLGGSKFDNDAFLRFFTKVVLAN